LGRYATGVSIVTAATPEGAVGITVNSFASVSLDPPLICWSISKGGDRFDIFSKVDRFAVNVLAADQSDLASRMAETLHLPDDLAWTPGADGAPLIDRAVTRLQCRTETRHDAGDHLMLIGRVTAYDQRQADALTFYRSRYGDAGRL